MQNYCLFDTLSYTTEGLYLIFSASILSDTAHVPETNRLTPEKKIVASLDKLGDKMSV